MSVLVTELIGQRRIFAIIKQNVKSNFSEFSVEGSMLFHHGVLRCWQAGAVIYVVLSTPTKFVIARLKIPGTSSRIGDEEFVF